MRLNAIAIGHKPPEDVNVVVEVGIGGEPIKYEMDKEAGTLVVDRFLHTPMRYPGNYEFGLTRAKKPKASRSVSAA
jgi:inorganic pyrophosphatase